MKNFRYLKNVTTLKYDETLCVGCRRCLEVCPHAVFDFAAGRARLSDVDACIECGACAKNCPVNALTVVAGVGCAAGLIAGWLQEKGLRPKQAGSC